MEVCQKEIQTSDSTAVCGPATHIVHRYPPSDAESRKIYQPQHTDLLPCTTTQSRGTDGSRKIDNSLQLDPRTRSADHHQHNTGPSGSSWPESQAQSGLKRKVGDHDDEPSHKRSSVPMSHTDRRFQGNPDDSRRRDDEKKRGINDGSTPRRWSFPHSPSPAVSEDQAC